MPRGLAAPRSGGAQRACSPSRLAGASSGKAGAAWIGRRAWDDRHHVVDSKDNLKQTGSQRRLFDNLPGLRVRAGAYVDTCASHNPKVFDICSAPCADEILRRSRGRLARSPPPTPVEWALKAVTPVPSASSTAVAKVDVFAPTASSTDASLAAASVASRATSTLRPIKGICERAWLWASAERESKRAAAAADVAAAAGDAARAACVEPAPPPSGEGQGSGGGPGSAAGLTPASPRRPLAAAKRTAKAAVETLVAFSQVPGQEPYGRFVAWARGKFGEPSRCWRVIDQDESLVISKAELNQELRNVGYRPLGKELEALWLCLDRDRSGVVSLLHFDPPTAAALATVKRWCTLRFGGVQRAVTSLDKDRNGTISLEEFSLGCRRHGFEFEDYLHLLFVFMGQERQPQMHASTLRFLDAWDCPEYFGVAADPAGANTFKELLMQRHKYNGLRAWRKSLDKDSSMRVCWLEFRRTVEQLRERHASELADVNPAAIWRHLDRHLTGFLSLEDFDADAFRLLSAFVTWAADKHGSVARAFRALMKEASNAERGLGRGKLARALGGTEAEGGRDLSQEDVDALFDGLNLEEGDRIQYNEVKFLENWSPSAEVEERRGWAKYFGPQLHRASMAMTAFEKEGGAS